MTRRKRKLTKRKRKPQNQHIPEIGSKHCPNQPQRKQTSAQIRTFSQLINRKLFCGEGKLNTQQVKLHIHEDVKPVVQPQRQIPYHPRKEVSKEIKRLVDEDIIEEPHDQPMSWISPTVFTPPPKKKKWHVYLACVDMRAAN